LHLALLDEEEPILPRSVSLFHSVELQHWSKIADGVEGPNLIAARTDTREEEEDVQRTGHPQ